MSEKQEAQKKMGSAQKPSQVGKETGQGVVRSFQTLPPRISCLLRLLGGLANLLQSRLKLEGLSYSCQGKTSMELSPSHVQGEQAWEPAPKVSSREKALEISPGAEIFIDRLKTKHEQRQD